MIKMNRFLYVLAFVTLSLQAGNLIVIHGSGRSGKTSVQKALITGDGAWSYVDQDELWIDGVAQAIEKQFSREYEIIAKAIAVENIFHAVERNLIIFKPDVSEKIRDDACAALIRVAAEWHDPNKTLRSDFEQQLRTSIVQSISARIEGGENIVADLPYYHEIEDRLKECRCAIYTVFLYCPFDVMVNRLEHKNFISIESGDLREHRLYYNILPHYLQVYEPCAEQDNAVGFIDSDMLHDSFACIKDSVRRLHEMYVVELPNFVREFNEDTIADVEKEYLRQFNIPEKGFAYIKPKLTYDKIINTTNMNPHEIAEMILDKFACAASNKEIRSGPGIVIFVRRS